MRLSKPVSLAVTAAAALTSVPAVQGSAQAVPATGTATGTGRLVDRHADRPSGRYPGRLDPGGPGCAASGKREFPVRTRIHGGPDAYEAGGGYRTWYIDLTNTTDAACENIHPVVVLVDSKRALKPEQPRLEFYDGDDGEPPRPVTFERTDEDEHIGVLGSGAEGDDFAGFTVAPGRTLSVKVRLAVTSDAVANDVVANAAVVQRQRDDGDWVGQSNDYRFRIVGGEVEKGEAEKGTEGETQKETEPGAGTGTGEGRAEDPGDPGDQGEREGSGAVGGVPEGLPFAEELARTGLSSPRAVLAAAAGALLLLGAGTAALIAARRSRR